MSATGTILAKHKILQGNLALKDDGGCQFSGFLVEPVSYAGIFAINAAVVALTIPLYWFVWIKRPKKQTVGAELQVEK